MDYVTLTFSHPEYLDHAYTKPDYDGGVTWLVLQDLRDGGRTESIAVCDHILTRTLKDGSVRITVRIPDEEESPGMFAAFKRDVLRFYRRNRKSRVTVERTDAADQSLAALSELLSAIVPAVPTTAAETPEGYHNPNAPNIPAAAGNEPAQTGKSTEYAQVRYRISDRMSIVHKEGAGGTPYLLLNFGGFEDEVDIISVVRTTSLNDIVTSIYEVEDIEALRERIDGLFGDKVKVNPVKMEDS